MAAQSSNACHASPHLGPSPLSRPGWAAALILLAMLGVAWAWLFRMDALGQILICRGAGAGFLASAGMWAVMMVAMMIPSALPMILTYAQLVARREPRSPQLGLVAVFAGVYLVAWSAFGVAAGAAEWLLRGEGVLRDGQLVSPVYAGALLVVAGLYQWSAVKTRCLSRCRSPLSFLLERHRGGYRGAATLGFTHSVLCAGCCWLLMLLAFVGGAMNLAWMVVLTLFVAAEKMLRAEAVIVHGAALALLGAGTVLVLGSVL
jgi:predicted metal-binding membrane protein